MAISPISYVKTFLEKEEYLEAFDLLEGVVIRKSPDEESLQQACAWIPKLLSQLTEQKQESILMECCEALQHFPNLKEQAVEILTLYGELAQKKGLSQGAIQSFASAACLIPSSELDRKLSNTILLQRNLSSHKRLKQKLNKVAGLEDPKPFQDLLESIDTLHQRFSTENSDIASLYEAAKEVYRGLNINQKRKYLDFWETFILEAKKDMPLNNEHCLVVSYRKKLEDVRAYFREKGKTREVQKERAAKMREFFQTLLEDAIFLLGEPPCKYDIRAMGSLAREEVCPYSDLEYFILIEKEEEREYFQTLIQIFDLQIRSLGEANSKQEFLNFKQKLGLQIDPADEPLIG
ncbi:MAG: hypothetical protein K940chlam9_02096, partial [Chlamydiae bacterium]|nr:hypothetical protein [Chlamydiota bacterium]